jgi:hypothetical protein
LRLNQQGSQKLRNNHSSENSRILCHRVTVLGERKPQEVVKKRGRFETGKLRK